MSSHFPIMYVREIGSWKKIDLGTQNLKLVFILLQDIEYRKRGQGREFLSFVYKELGKESLLLKSVHAL